MDGRELVRRRLASHDPSLPLALLCCFYHRRMIMTIQVADGDRTGGRGRGFVTSLARLHHRDKATTISHSPRTGLVIPSFAISTPCPQLFSCERTIKPAGSPFHAQLISFILIFQPKPKYSCPTISSDPYSHILSRRTYFVLT